MEDRTHQGEPRVIGGRSVESGFSIGHPLSGSQSKSLESAGALDLFVESVSCLQDGDDARASTLYQEALEADPSLHAHARDALSTMLPGCSPEAEGAICYWLGIHSQYLKDYDQALIWYARAIAAYHQIGYQKREGRAHCNLGTLKMQLGDPSGIHEYEKAIALNPMDGIAHTGLGAACYLMGDYERALDAFADAVWADPARYAPLVFSRLQRFGYTWQEDLEKIGQRVAKKQGIDLDKISIAEREDIFRAYDYFEKGNGFFQSGRYKEALEQFEKGKLITRKVPGNFLGASMTAMQMIELRAIPEDQIPFYLVGAEQNIDECLRIAPTNLDYLNAKDIISEYKRKVHVS